LNQFISQGIAVLQYIENEPGIIVGPITMFLGMIIDFVFRIIYSISQPNSLGWSIIILTIVARTLMLPMGMKSQKSTFKMQKLAPEVNKIKAKYAGTKDPELQRKMNAEIQAVYAENKVNMLSGCLPLLIQMPIFFALSYLLRQCYLFIPSIHEVYTNLGTNISQMDGWIGIVAELGKSKVPDSMLKNGATFDFAVVQGVTISAAEAFENLLKLLNRFTEADWAIVFENMAGQPALLQDTQAVYATKQSIETFFGISLVNNAGMTGIGVIIPILTAGTTFLSSFVMNKTNPNADSQQKTQQKMMMLVMPVMMFFMTSGMSAGVGLYWIASSVYQTVQQYLLHKHYTKRGEKEVVKA